MISFYKYKSKYELKSQLFHFNLIELLLVIAILAILGSLLQPSLQNVLKNTRTLGCKNHLRSVGATLSLYADDHLYYPPASFASPTSIRGYLYGSWDDLLGMGYDGRELTWNEVYKPNLTGENYATNLYTCPQQSDLNDDGTSNNLRSFAMNSAGWNRGFSEIWPQPFNAATGWGKTIHNARVTAVTEVAAPEDTFLLAETSSRLGNGYQLAGISYRWQERFLDSSPEKTHDTLFNYLFADNHVDLYHLSETINLNYTPRWHRFDSKYWSIDPND